MTLDEFLSKLDIVSVVSRYIRLRPEGDRYWGNCPFHHEKTSSFNVSQSKQVYHCFGCKESGNVIGFIKKIENCDFQDSLRILCRDFGIELPEIAHEKSNKGNFENKETLIQLLKESALHYYHNLKRPEGETARKYLKSRGVPQEMIVKFGLGLSLNSKAILTHLSAKGYTTTQMIQAGVASTSRKDSNDSKETESLSNTVENNTNNSYRDDSSFDEIATELKNLNSSSAAENTSSESADNTSISNTSQNTSNISPNINDCYDAFAYRLIVPIVNNLGQVIGFGGRDLSGKDGVAKYKNSRQSYIFDKSNTVFGINNLKKLKQTKGLIPYIILVEGYFDVIALHSAGFDTAVACMGTALTIKQARQIKNYSENIYISFDGDTAGDSATLRSLDILSSVGLIVRVLELPDGLDPDNVIQKHGSSGYQELIEQAEILPMFKIKNLSKNVQWDDTAQRTKFAADACRVVASLDNEILKDECRQVVHNFSGYSIESLKNQEQNLNANVLEDSTVTNTNTGVSVDALSKAVEYVMASLVQSKEWVDFNLDIYDFLTVDLHRSIYQLAIHNFKHPKDTKSFSTLYTELDDEQSKILGELLAYEFLPSNDHKLDFVGHLNKIKIAQLEKEKQELQEKCDATGDFALLKRISEISKEIRNIKSGK